VTELVKEQMERHSVSMEPIYWAIIHQVAKDMGLSSRSAGLRFIIREWERMKQLTEGLCYIQSQDA